MMNPPDTLQQLLEALPDFGPKAALMKLHGEDHETSSYDELSETARGLAGGLIRDGVQPGDVVGLLAPLGFAWTSVCLGALQAGATVMPLDLQLEKQTLAGILEDSDPACIFTAADQQDRLRQAGAERLRVRLLDRPGDDPDSWKRLLRRNGGSLPKIAPDHRAALFYTSGTTGPPKGVPLSHANLAFQIETVRETGLIQAGDRVLLPLPPHHVYPFVIGILAPLSLGLTIVLPYSLTGPQIVRALRKGETTLLLGVPRLYDALFNGISARFDSNPVLRLLFHKGLRTDIAIRRITGFSAGKWVFAPVRRRFGPRLRIMASGGAPLPPELAWKLEAMGWQVAAGYGLTETAPLLTIKRPGDPHHDTVGRAVPGVSIRIDAEAPPASAASGASPNQGEILAKGPNVFSGYHRLPDKTAEAFTRDGWFRTGDLGYLDPQGYLRVTGRVSTLIVTKSGENIQPDEVETHLASHAWIREAGVLQLEDGTLAALVVPELKEALAEGQEDEGQIVQQAVAECSKELPSYQRVNEVALSRRPLPRTRLGKIRRHLLAERFTQAKEEQAAGSRGKAAPMPVSEMAAEDRRLLENPAANAAWACLAERYPERRLSPDSIPELDLAIDSMEWFNITLELRQRAGIVLAEETIAEISTVRDLLKKAAEKSTAGEGGAPASPWEDPERVLSRTQMRWLEPLSAAEHRLVRSLFAVNDWIARHVFRLRVQGRENLPVEGPFIVTPNHVSYLDAFVVAAALGFDRFRHVFWAGFTGIVLKNPFFRYFSRLAGTVPIDPLKGTISSMAFGAAVLRRNLGLVWFPEGARSPDGRLQPFKAGLGVLLEHYPVPVIPAFIRGTETILPPGRALPRRGTIAIAFGRPLGVEDLADRADEGEKKRQIAEALHEAVDQLGKRMRHGDRP
jgi:long-chain acyl-CoA synthetase